MFPTEGVKNRSGGLEFVHDAMEERRCSWVPMVEKSAEKKLDDRDGHSADVLSDDEC